jgi:hypothetical protein
VVINTCNTPDFLYPLKADIYYPIVEQGAYGNVQKTWVVDRTIICNFAPAGTAWGEEVKPNPMINMEMILLGRVKDDLRISESSSKDSIVNIIITNIRTRNDQPIYIETAGPRSGRSTLFEIASNEPIINPFGEVDYYKVVIRRSENQASDL